MVGQIHDYSSNEQVKLSLCSCMDIPFPPARHPRQRLCGLRYVEEEFWVSIIKFMVTIVFMVIARVLVLGDPTAEVYDKYWGARLWHDPGAFHIGFRGFCSAFMTVAFAFSSTELVGLATEEANSPAGLCPEPSNRSFGALPCSTFQPLFCGVSCLLRQRSLAGHKPICRH